MQQSDSFTGILRAAILALGVWAIYAQVSVLIGRTFNELLSGAWVPASALLLLAIGWQKLWRGVRLNKPGPKGVSAGTRAVMILALMSVTGIFIWHPGHPIAASIYVIAVLVSLALIDDRLTTSTVPKEYESGRNQTAIVLIVIIASMIITLCEHRVNWDDAKYLHNVANALEHPNEPMLVYENLHGVKQLKVYHPSVRLQTYELLVAAISKVSGMNHLHLYYLILPPIFAALAVIAQWTLIRRFAGKHAGLALVATFLLLSGWGGYRSYGAFSFDFVGRGMFLSFAVPALISAALDFAEMGNFRSWLFLFLVTWTGCLLTSTAYAVAPFAVCLVWIACYGLSFSKIRDFGGGLLAIVWCPLLLAYATWVTPIVTPLDVDSPGGAHFVFRASQGRIALALFGLAPFFMLLARLQSARWLLRYNALCFLILLSGVLLKWIGQYSSILSWRLLWAVPVPVIIGVGLSAGIDFFQQRLISHDSLRKILAPVGLAVVVIAFSIAGDTVVFRNFGWPEVKMDRSSFPVAWSLVQCSKPTDLMLAPPEIAVPMSGLLGAPSLVAVRGHYLSYLSSQWGKVETERRSRLFNVVQGKINSPEDVTWTREQLLSGSINRILLKKNNHELYTFKEMLRSLKVNHIELRNWEVWVPNTSATEAMQIQSCLKQAENQSN